MLAEPAPEQKSPLKNPLLYSSAVFMIVLIYVGYIFISRWQENRTIEQRAVERQAATQQQQDRATVEQMGGKELAIQNFYGSPAVVKRGVDVKPTKTTTYTLTAEDATGHSVTQTLEIKVR
jgi:cytoskeletal protein RodZ